MADVTGRDAALLLDMLLAAQDAGALPLSPPPLPR
jgi:hypothetical protein